MYVLFEQHQNVELEYDTNSDEKQNEYIQPELLMEVQK